MSETNLIELYQRLLDELLVRRQRLGVLSEDEEVERADEMFEVWQGLDENARAELEAWVAEQMRPISVDAPQSLGLVDLVDARIHPFAA